MPRAEVLKSLRAVGARIRALAAVAPRRPRVMRRGVLLQRARHIIGHAGARMTSRIYANLSVEDLRDAVEAIPQVPLVAPARRDAS